MFALDLLVPIQVETRKRDGGRAAGKCIFGARVLGDYLLGNITLVVIYIL
jgi:hypothetical protein